MVNSIQSHSFSSKFWQRDGYEPDKPSTPQPPEKKSLKDDSQTFCSI